MESIVINDELYIIEESVYDIETKDKSIYEIYYNTIRYFPIPTEDEVKYLFHLYTTDKSKEIRNKAKEDLVNFHLRLVCRYAHKISYKAKRLDINDLIQEGNMILLKAIDVYSNKNLDIPFVAYLSSMLKYGMINAINEKDRLYRIPNNILQDYNKIKASYEFLNKYSKNKKITIESLQNTTGISEKRIKKALRLVQEEIYLDKPIKDGESNSKSIGDTIIDSTALELHEKLVESELKKDINKALTSLTKKEKNIIMQMIEAQHRNIPIEQVALDNFINKKEVEAIKQRAVKKLRQNQKVSSYVNN